MTELYIIAHKVRGEVAFDVAHRLEIADDEGWIIPTSGHRAYPFWFEELKCCIDMYYQHGEVDHPMVCPTDLPDHYPPKSSPAETKSSANDLLAQLGLPTKVHSAVCGTLKRRI